MITDAQKDEALLKYYQRGILKKEVRSYEVSLWTLQDQFMTVLKWSDVEQKGRIEEPKMTLDVDGTQNFTFKIPMYINKWDENANYASRLTKVENPIWYNTQNGNLIEGMRKVKVIFNKMTADEKVFEFIIIKVTEKHEGDIATCEVECEGLAFHELGKVGYKLSLSQDNFEWVYKEWSEKGTWTKYDGTIADYQPLQTLQYWCEEGAHLVPLPAAAQRNAQTWYYQVDMDWSSFAFSGNIARDKHKVYEEPFTTAWTTDLEPKAIAWYQEKARPVEANQSNLYNITQTIAEQFGVHCRYEFTYDENYQITSKVVVFYNNYNRENDGVLGFTYPYSSKTVSRNVDVTDLTTKLYISSIDSDNSLEGVITIMNSPANKTKEDYILNFDYIHKIGGITDEQYEAIKIYEKEIRAINDILIPLQSELEAFETKKIEVEAKLTTYTNSIKLDQEQIDYNQGLGNALTVQNGDGDGYVSITAASPDSAIIISPEEGIPYINLQHTNKGIDVNTVHVYRKWIAGEQRCTDEVTKFNPITDPEYGNLIKLEGIQPDSNNVRTVYLTYKYKPQLYYDNIIKTWETKLASDTQNKDDLTAELAKINIHIADDTAAIKAKILEKDEKIRAFEHMMGPALREGYWNPDDYNDYGEVKSTTISLPSTASFVFTDDTIEDEVVIGWDELLFDDEDKIYYEVGNNQTKTYYPCVNLTSIFASNPNNIRDHINEYSFIFNTNYYDSSADLTNARYIKAFAVGSEALLRYVKDQANNVYPVLVLVGAKNMSDGSNGSTNELAFMKAQNNGHPRIGIIKTTISGTSISTSITNVTAVHADSYWTFGSNLIQDCTQVVPRIKFNNTSVKADTTNLQIAYNGKLLEPYINYQILTRVTHYGDSEHPIDHPEYYITIKPDTLWKCGTYTGDAKINYIVANLATSIYVDALEISKKNAEPKVEYNLDANIVDENILHTLYKELARIIMITDNDLKLEDAFGYISHIELNLDKPEEDSIEIKNYKSKFEDLFSTIVAQTEAAQRDSNGIASALSGNIGLSAVGFAATLLNNEDTLTDFLDSYFTSSPTVEETLEGLFTEAGEILGDSNKVLGTAVSLSLENAGILGNFASRVVQELSPKVTKSTTRPTDFKVGDIWVQTEAIPNTSPVEYREVGRYVATSDALHSVDGYGFTRTYDGTLAAIEGASLNIDAVAGTLEILAHNRIDMKSGGDIYIAANEKVDIVGNKSVNIGGTQINLGSTTIDGSNVQGGINIVATAYGTQDFEDAYESKVLIHPEEIFMAGAKLTIVTGSTQAASAVNAIELDGSKGIWIGSSKKISLFSSNNNGNNANVEISPTHIFFGMNNTTNGNTTAAELNENYIIMTAGVANSSSAVGNVSSIVSNGITIDGSLAGVEIRKDKIGLAVGSGNGRSAIIMNSSGMIIGTRGNGNAPQVNGSYVSISGTGIIIGSKGNMEVTTTNFKIKSDATETTPMFYVANNGTWANANNGIQYTPSGGLEVKGTITANTLYIVDNNTPTEATAWINAKVTPEAIWLGVVKHTTGNNNATVGSSTSLEITDNKFEIKSTGDFIVDAANVKIKTNAGNGESIFKLTDGASTNAVNYINIAKNSSGVLTAQIGGWLISDKKLYSGSSGTYVALDANTSDSYAVWCGAESDVSAPFAVTRGGDVFLNSLLVLDNEHKINPSATQVTRGSDKYSKVEFSKLNFNQAIVLSLTCGGTSINVKGVFLGTWTQTAQKNATASLSSVNAGAASVAWGVGETTVTVSVADSGSLVFEHVIVDASGIAQNAANIVQAAADRAETACAYTSGSATFKIFNGIYQSGYGAWAYTEPTSHTITADVSMYRSGRRVYAKGIAKVSGTSVAETSYSYIDVPEDTGGGGGDNCFVGDTLVTMIDNTNTPIELLRMGDILLAYDEVNNQQVETEVVAIRKYKNSHDISEIRLPNRKPLFLTKSHTVLTADGWKALDIPSASHENPQLVINQLTVEDKMIDSNGNQVDILEIIDHPEMDGTPVYNIDVEPYDTYIVENVVVHNAIEKQA